MRDKITNTEEIAQAFYQKLSFYNCICGWKGDKLAYLTEDAFGHKKGQGYCPECRCVFDGCFHPDLY